MGLRSQAGVIGQSGVSSCQVGVDAVRHLLPVAAADALRQVHHCHDEADDAHADSKQSDDDRPNVAFRQKRLLAQSNDAHCRNDVGERCCSNCSLNVTNETNVLVNDTFRCFILM